MNLHLMLVLSRTYWEINRCESHCITLKTVSTLTVEQVSRCSIVKLITIIPRVTQKLYHGYLQKHKSNKVLKENKQETHTHSIILWEICTKMKGFLRTWVFTKSNLVYGSRRFIYHDRSFSRQFSIKWSKCQHRASCDNLTELLASKI